MKNYAMRFISGKYQGGEFPLPPSSEIIVGRSSDLDMVLVEDMVSRRHAKIVVNGDLVTIQDLGSTNGTFVNGERIERMNLADGDRVLIGTSIIKLVTTDTAAPPASSEGPKKHLEEVAAHRRSSNQVRSMSGAIDEVPLPDLLQLFGSSKKTGVLVIRSDTCTGKVFLEQGRIVYATINDSEALSPEKAVYRILAWRHGTFYMEPVESHDLPARIEMSAEGALMEGMRILDEVNRHELPPMRARVSVKRPLGARLRDLGPEELDVFQVALEQSRVEAVFNNCALADVDIANALRTLFDRGYLEASEEQ